MLSKDARADIECCLADAVRACLGHPADQRPQFIGQYLLAKLDGTNMPNSQTVYVSGDQLQVELNALASTLTKALNIVAIDATESPLRMLARYLIVGEASASTLSSSNGGAQPVVNTATSGSGTCGSSTRSVLKGEMTGITNIHTIDALVDAKHDHCEEMQHKVEGFATMPEENLDHAAGERGAKGNDPRLLDASHGHVKEVSLFKSIDMAPTWL